MKIIKIKQHLSVFISLAFIFSIIAFSPIVHKAFAQPQQASATEPADGQIIPFYEVWLRWNDVSDEDHYILSVRDITSETTQPLNYEICTVL